MQTVEAQVKEQHSRATQEAQDGGTLLTESAQCRACECRSLHVPGGSADQGPEERQT